MPTNDYLAFATGVGANVEDQATYAADSARTVGNQSGLARSAIANKAWRQSSVVSAALTNLVVSVLGVDTLDNGDISALSLKMAAMIDNYAITRAAAAQAAASGDATTKSAAAQAAAIAAAAGDATTKANAAQAAAISTASSDATTKANAALSSANTHSDAGAATNAAAIAAINAMTAVHAFTNPGYAKMAGGLIFMWGFVTITGPGETFVVLPNSFPSAHLISFVSQVTASPSTGGPTSSLDNTDLSHVGIVYSGTGDLGHNFLSIGV